MWKEKRDSSWRIMFLKICITFQVCDLVNFTTVFEAETSTDLSNHLNTTSLLNSEQLVAFVGELLFLRSLER